MRYCFLPTKPMMMKHKIRSLEDIYLEKLKVQKEIALREYAIKLHYKEIKNKMTFVSLSGYVFGLLKKQLTARMPGIFAGLLNGFLSSFRKSRK